MKHIDYFHVCRTCYDEENKLRRTEELILLTVGVLYPDAYGVAVMDEIEKQAGRNLNISAVHAVLTRLEEKGLLKSKMSEPSEVVEEEKEYSC
jgi:PadR family transcriptional regulator, regulatory protein PadR